MIIYTEKRRHNLGYRILCGFIAVSFLFNMLMPSTAAAQTVVNTLLGLPVPGSMVQMTPGFTPPMMIGVTVHPDNPLLFDFLIHNGDDKLQGTELKEESRKCIKYFLASLTIPEDELWVNLSPYEKDRIISEKFGQTEMGRDLLAQDYLLKQLTSSLIYPESETGKKFWDRVYKKAHKKYGTADIPVDTFNKVWITPENASVYETNGTTFVVGSRLKVMLAVDYENQRRSSPRGEAAGLAKGGLEADYLAMKMENSENPVNDPSSMFDLQSSIIREIIIPELEREVNEGKTFAQLRQIFNSMILATWYKKNLTQSLLGQVYVDQAKIKGVETDDPQIKQKIYEQYLTAMKQGVFNYIKEDFDPATKEMIPRKYFSGGFGATNLSTDQFHQETESAMLPPSEIGVLRSYLANQSRIFSNLTQLAELSPNANRAVRDRLENLSSPSPLTHTDSAMMVDTALNPVTIDKVNQVAPEFLKHLRQAPDGTYTEEQVKALNYVVEAGQEHTIALSWQAAKGNVDLARQYLQQVAKRQRTYPFGLEEYRNRHKGKLSRKHANENPYKGKLPHVPEVVDNTRIDSSYWQAMDRGIQAAKDLVIMLAQGGIGDRLKWLSARDLKTDMVNNPVFDWTYMETFIREILALQGATNKANGTDIQIPYVNMTSGTTTRGLMAYLKENNYFGMAGVSFIDVTAGEKAEYDPVLKKIIIRSPDGKTRDLQQIVLFQQEDVFAADNWDGKWVMDIDPKKKHLIMEKGHNHGDVNLLMDMSSLARAYKDAGKKYGMYHQDTNAETFKAAIPALGNMLEKKKKLSIVSVPIKLGEKAGSLVLMEDPATGKRVVRNVEYSDVQEMFGDKKVQEHFQRSNLTPENFIDGNINVFVMDLGDYANILAEKQGIVGEEIVNPKADTLVSRLEAMIQDVFEEFYTADIIVNRFDSRLAFNATKNSPRNALIAQSQKLFSEHLAETMAHGWQARRRLLKAATDVAINAETGQEDRVVRGMYFVQTWKNTQTSEEKFFIVGWDGNNFEGKHDPNWVLDTENPVEGISFPTGARLTWSPDWAQTEADLKEKWQGGEISDDATVGINGKNIFLRNVHVVGNSTFLVKTNPGQTLVMDGLTVDNEGWEYKKLTPEEVKATDDTHSPLEKMRGFKIIKNEQMMIDLTLLRDGNYTVDKDGNIRWEGHQASIVRDESILKWQTPGKQKSGKHETSAETLGKIIKEYDFRGYDGGDPVNFPTQIDEELGIWIGRGLGSVNLYSDAHERSVSLQPGDLFLTAGDNGPRTPEVKRWLAEGVMDTGVHVLDLGAVGSGVLFSAIKRLGAKGGVYVTRSHVEVGTNGGKPNIGGITLYGNMLKRVGTMILSGQYRKADTRGESYDQNDERAKIAVREYFGELRQKYAPLAERLKKTSLPITVNMAGGSLTEVKEYNEFFNEMFGHNLKGILRGEPDPWGKEGVADSTRTDALGKIVAYSREHPDELIFNFDLDADRVTILWGGELYLGDKMFYPIIEYMLTMDPAHQALDQSIHRGLNRTYFYDSRMTFEVKQLIEHFGGIAKIHCKGHSLVKASMDMILAQLAKNEGKTVQEFLDDHPGFQLLQAEYTTHMFTTNAKGEAFDDAVLYMFAWLDMFTQVREKHAKENPAALSWTLAEYIQYLREEGVLRPMHQLPESRMPILEDAKFKVMWEMTNQIRAAYEADQNFAYVPEWDWRNDVPQVEMLLQNVNGVFDFQTALGEMFWAWSNTSPKIALGAQGRGLKAQKILTAMVTALYIHSRNKVAKEMGVELERIHPLEIGKLFSIMDMTNHVGLLEGIDKSDFEQMQASPEGRKRIKELEAKWFPVIAEQLENKVLAIYPTMESVLEAMRAARDETTTQDSAQLTAESFANIAVLTRSGTFVETGSVRPLLAQDNETSRNTGEAIFRLQKVVTPARIQGMINTMLGRVVHVGGGTSIFGRAKDVLRDRNVLGEETQNWYEEEILPPIKEGSAMRAQIQERNAQAQELARKGDKLVFTYDQVEEDVASVIFTMSPDRFRQAVGLLIEHNPRVAADFLERLLESAATYDSAMLTNPELEKRIKGWSSAVDAVVLEQVKIAARHVLMKHRARFAGRVGEIFDLINKYGSSYEPVISILFNALKDVSLKPITIQNDIKYVYDETVNGLRKAGEKFSILGKVLFTEKEFDDHVSSAIIKIQSLEPPPVKILAPFSALALQVKDLVARKIKQNASAGTDSAQMANDRVGGINLDPKLFDLQIKRDGNGVPLPVNFQSIENMHIEGFVPIIINVTPATNLPLFLGLKDDMSTNPQEVGYNREEADPLDKPQAAADMERFQQVALVKE